MEYRQSPSAKKTSDVTLVLALLFGSRDVYVSRLSIIQPCIKGDL